MEKIKAASFSVSGMHCDSCLMLIKMDLQELEGIKEVSGSWKEGIIQVAFDESKTGIKEIMQKIEQDGYKVKKQGRQK